MKLIHSGVAAAALGLIALTAPVPLAVAADPGTTGKMETGKMTELANGLKYTDNKVGTGAEATPGHQVTVNYTGWLYNNGKKGAKFDSSLDRNEPFTFGLGAHQVIPGWDQGVAGMKVGGERTLIIPPDLAYGRQGAGGVIPPNATLMFDVSLLKVD